MDNNFRIFKEYKSNLENAYYTDNVQHCIFQQDVYKFANYLLKDTNIEYVIDIGSGNGEKLKSFDTKVILADYGDNLTQAREVLGDKVVKTFEINLDNDYLEIEDEILEKAIVICSDVIEHIRNPKLLLESLSNISKKARYLLISTPDRTRARGVGDVGVPGNLAHVREWNIEEFNMLLIDYDFNKYQIGYTYNNTYNLAKNNIFVLSGTNMNILRDIQQVKVLAIIHCYNEEDIIVETVNHLLNNGIDVKVLDNYSTDNSYKLLLDNFKDNDRVMLSQFPEQHTEMYEWKMQLEETEKIAKTFDYDWFIHYDCDEFRQSPWLGYSLREAISFVDYLGYNAIDFCVVNFKLTKETNANLPIQARLNRYMFGEKPGHKVQVKCWKKCSDINISESGGHKAEFENCKVYPIKFLNKHYPMRSVEQANNKVFFDRKDRFEKENKLYGWHTQYNNICDEEDLYTDSRLTNNFDMSFYNEFIIERISSIY